jgi:Tetraspanin family.
MNFFGFCVKLVECFIRLKLNFICCLQYSLCLLIFFLLEMAIAIMGFVFPHKMQSVLEEQFTDKIIHTYREDVDLQNLIDFAQQEVRNSSISLFCTKLCVFEKHLFHGNDCFVSCTSFDAVDSVQTGSWIGQRMNILTVVHQVWNDVVFHSRAA